MDRLPPPRVARWLAAALPLLGFQAAQLASAQPPFEPVEQSQGALSVTEAEFGTLPDGTAVTLYSLCNSGGVRVKLTNYGGIVTSIQTPDRTGQAGEITLGFDTLKEYLAGHPYFGALVGRYANRIAAGRFSLDGRQYVLARNNGPNHLHGGEVGFDKVVWHARPFRHQRAVGVRLRYVSKDGEEGYPGNLAVEVTYSLTEDNELRIDYQATTDKPTPINLTNHTYWNLAGPAQGRIDEHQLVIYADHYLPVDEGLIPTGELRSVQGTPMDFREPHAIGERIEQVPGGYDHCYVLVHRTDRPDDLERAAWVHDPHSGRVLEVLTTEPGIQLYTGNFLDGSLASRGAVFHERTGFCLETQHFPDSPNQPSFPNTILRPGQTFRSTTVYRFSVQP
jgi:aldose 1-epimerase